LTDNHHNMSRLSDVLSIRHPIVQSGMGRVAGPELAAAVSRAGGLGILAALNLSPDDLRRQIRRIRELTDRPFGVNLWLHPDLLPPVDPARLASADVAAATAALNHARRTIGLPEANEPPPRRADTIAAAIENNELPGKVTRNERPSARSRKPVYNDIRVTADPAELQTYLKAHSPECFEKEPDITIHRVKNR